MNKCHLFFPENDMALARDIERYTAPPAAVQLRRSGLTLPLWYGDDGDTFIAQGVNAAWLHSMQQAFDININVYDYRPEAYLPAPWGWSKASRIIYRQLGFDAAALPDDDMLRRLRMLSHRRTAAEIGRRLYAATGLGTCATELFEVDAVRAYLDRIPHAILKLPWSSSGRGMVAVDASTFEVQKGMIQGMIHRQGSVMAEAHRYDKTLDFAMLYNMEDGHCRAAGLSVFETSGLGIYTSNVLMSEDSLRDLICDKIGSDAFETIGRSLPPILEEVIGSAYDGPLGVDMMAVADRDMPVEPVVELNLRMTMGHLCARLHGRIIAADAVGRFHISAERRPDDADISDHRIRYGHMNLNPPGSDMSFAIDIGNLERL